MVFVLDRGADLATAMLHSVSLFPKTKLFSSECETPKVLLEPICYDLLDVSLARNLFPDDPGEGGGIQFDLAKTDQSLWLGVRDKPFFAAGDILKVKDQVGGCG